MAEAGSEVGAGRGSEGVAETTTGSTSQGSSAAPTPPPTDRSRPRTLWLVINSALIVLIAVGVYYFFYTKARQTYIAERNYRLLSAAGRQFETRFDALLTIFDSAVSECSTSPAKYPDDCKQQPTDDQWQCCMQHSSLRLGTTVQRADCGLLPQDPSFAISKGKSSTAFLTDTPMGNEKQVYISAGSPERRLCGTVALGDLIDLTLASKMFERVLLVNRGGEVLYQQGPKLTRPTETHKILEEQWQALCPSPGGQSKTEAKDGHTETASTDSVPYAQLVRLTSAPSATCDPAQHWMIIGLVPPARALAEPMAVPLGSLIPATYLLLLAGLAWPLIKLWQMSTVERLRTFELHVLVLAGLTATGMLTFAMLSSMTEAAASARLDENLQEIARTLQWRFQDEIHCAFAELNEFSKSPPQRDAIQYYPWFMNVVSVDEKGTPIHTFKPASEDGNRWHLEEAPTLTFNIGDRPYFHAARAPKSGDSLRWTWTIPARAHAGAGAVGSQAHTSECLDDDPGQSLLPDHLAHFAIEPLVARSSGAMMVVLAVQNSASAHGVGPGGVNTLATRLQSLTQPVLPVGFQFAVVDRDGLVQFHADPTRNLQENFFDETYHDRALRAAVLTRRAEHLDVNYYAWPERAYVMPLGDTPWSLIVFHQQLMSVSLSFAVAIAWLCMWGMYLAIYIVADLIVQWIRPGYPAAWLWPDRERRYVFALLGLAVTGCLAASFVLQDASAAVAFAVMVVVAPVTALAVVYVSSRRRPPLGRGLGTLFGAVAGALLLRFNGHSWYWSAAGATAFFVALGYAASRFPASPRRNEWAFRCGYVTATCALLLICGVLPATLFFRDAYQQSAQNFSKYVQWRFAEDLIERATRVRREFTNADAGPDDSTKRSALVNSRLNMRWDVYDHCPYEGGCRPSTAASKEAAPQPAELGPRVPQDLCAIDVVDPADLPNGLHPSGPSSPPEVCATQDDSSTRTPQGVFDPIASLLWRPAVDDWFADLLPNLSESAATDHAWEWAGPAGHPFIICDQRLNEQIGMPGTCKRPLRIGWGLVPVRFTTGVSPAFALAAGIAALFMFGLTWTLVRFLFGLDADANGRVRQDRQAAPTAALPEEMWSGMDATQKLALAQTAIYGLPNPKNREAITTLLRQGVLVRRPELAIASPAVRKFVRSSKARNDIHQLEKGIPPSDWSRLRGPLSILAVCFALFLFGTQQGLVDSAAALLTGLTATIGAVTAALARLSGAWNRGIPGLLSDGGSGEKKP